MLCLTLKRSQLSYCWLSLSCLKLTWTDIMTKTDLVPFAAEWLPKAPLLSKIYFANVFCFNHNVSLANRRTPQNWGKVFLYFYFVCCVLIHAVMQISLWWCHKGDRYFTDTSRMLVTTPPSRWWFHPPRVHPGLLFSVIFRTCGRYNKALVLAGR